MSNHKSTESAIKNFEIQVGQLAKQIAENSPRSFGANTEKNPKEERKAIMTRSKREIIVEDESVRQVASDILRRGVELRYHKHFLIKNFILILTQIPRFLSK